MNRWPQGWKREKGGEEEFLKKKKGRGGQVHAGGETKRKKRKAFQQPQSTGDPPPSCPLIPCCYSTPPPKLSPSHTHTLYRPHLATFQLILPDPLLISPRNPRRNSPPALKHFISPRTNFLRLLCRSLSCTHWLSLCHNPALTQMDRLSPAYPPCYRII